MALVLRHDGFEAVTLPPEDTREAELREAAALIVQGVELLQQRERRAADVLAAAEAREAAFVREVAALRAEVAALRADLTRLAAEPRIATEPVAPAPVERAAGRRGLASLLVTVAALAFSLGAGFGAGALRAGGNPPPVATAPPGTPAAADGSAVDIVFSPTSRGTVARLGVPTLLPGDTFRWTATIVNRLAQTVRAYRVVAEPGGAPTSLWTDAAAGLKLRIERGVDTFYDGPIASASVAVPAALAPGASQSVAVLVSLPGAAGAQFQGLAQEVDLRWTADLE